MNRPPARPPASTRRPAQSLSAVSVRAELAVRRQQLLASSDMLRRRLLHESAALAPGLVAADRARAGWRWIADRPLVPLAAVAVLLLLRRRRVLGLALRALALWRLWRSVRPWLRSVARPRP